MKKTVVFNKIYLLAFLGIMIFVSLVSPNKIFAIGLTKVAESDVLILNYDFDKHIISVVDKRNNYTWKSTIEEEEYPTFEKASKTWKGSMSSLFNISYSDLTTNKLTNPVVQNAEIKAETIQNGIKAIFSFDNAITVVVEITLEGNTLNIRIPIDEINETEGTYLSTIEMMPFMGSAIGHEEGYFLCPDGSGALLRFTSIARKNVGIYSWPVYGFDVLDIDKEYKEKKEGKKNAMLPVFGSKKGDNAFLAIITEGEADSVINLYPKGNAVDIYRIAPTFNYRRTYEDLRPDMVKITYYEKDIIKTDRSLKYIFLQGEEADYNGMAKACREYLLESGKIRKSTVYKDGEIPMSLSLFMGVMERQVMFNKFITMTSFKQAKEILKTFIDNGVKNITLNLIGWTKKGYGQETIHLPPSIHLGGERQLKELSKFAEDNGIRLLLQDNFLDANGKAGGFSKKNDTVHHKTDVPITDKYRERYWLNPIKSLERFTKMVKKIGSYKIDGFTFERMGELLYYDSGKDYGLNRSDSATTWMEFLKTSNEQFGMSGVDGGNAYVLNYADWIMNLPIEDSEYFITDEAVPFYQMVIHGFIPYSSKPGNLFYDYPYQKLKWIEYGCIPYFELTYNESGLMKFTDYNTLFTSSFKQWSSIAIETWKEFNSNFGDLTWKLIIRHENLEKDLVKITYEDGVVIYINYSEDTAYIEGFNVGALDYLVVR